MTRRVVFSASVRVLVITVALLCVVVTTSSAQPPGLAAPQKWSIAGYVKILALAGHVESAESSTNFLLHQRFNLEYRPSSQLRFSAAVRNRLYLGDTLSIDGFAQQVGSDGGAIDLTSNWLERGDLLATSTLDRLYLDWQPNQYRVRLGRHRINWGMATRWNPNDLFNSYSVYDLDYEERSGSDALLISRSLGFASRLELVWAVRDPHSQGNEHSVAARYLFNVNPYDLQLVVGDVEDDYVLGFGFAGNVGGAGLRGEMSYFTPQHSGESDSDDRHSVVVATLESDYSFAGRRNLLVGASLLYLSPPPDELVASSLSLQPSSARNLSFTRWTTSIDLSFDITALSRQALGLSYYDDDSYYLFASNDISLSDDFELQLVLQHFNGAANSLFGQQSNTVGYARLRWSF